MAEVTRLGFSQQIADLSDQVPNNASETDYVNEGKDPEVRFTGAGGEERKTRPNHSDFLRMQERRRQ